ncbi:trunk [Haematobia irritans]|uniref:trunk n=1 Tax=Haematobia irritans TaxID=7368 RepID=UPI003F502CDD
MKLLTFALFFGYLAINLANTDYCTQLSTKSLAKILGQAFNPRYMSIDPPFLNQDSDSKRSSYEIPFYADNDVVSVGDFPAWETDHINYYEEKKAINDKKVIRVRDIFKQKSSSNDQLSKTRPWECASKLTWLDLGINYFPRYIRSVECISNSCWYGHYNCKPKSFTIKVLRRKHGSCIRINEKLLLLTSEHFSTDYTELWVWEEVSVNFCCDCVTTTND